MKKNLNRPQTAAATHRLILLALWVAMLLHFVFFLAVGLSRHWGYLSSINDLGVFDQVVWNTLQGNFFQNSINPFSQSINWLGFHFNPILLLFVPLYAVSPSAEWFVLAQAASLSLAAWPIFLLASHIFHCKKTGLLWAVVYLTNPFQLSAGAWDFHPVSLAVPFLALALLAVVKKNAKLLFVSCLVILTCQEHFGLTVAGLGALWWLRHRNWQPGIALIVLGGLHLSLVLGVVMPFFSLLSGPVMLGDQLGQLSRYSWLGSSLADVVHTLTTEPLLVGKQLVAMGGVSYWLLLIAPFGFLFPLLGIEFLLAGLGDLAANTLSANPMPRGIWAYHSVGLIPALTVAAIYGVSRLSSRQNKFSARELTGLVLISSVTLGYIFFPAPLPGAKNIWAPAHFPLRPDPTLQAVRAATRNDASLSVQANVGGHFSQRQKIYLYPQNVGDTEIIILRLASPTTNINNYPGPANQRKFQPTLLDGHLQMDRARYLASITCFVSAKNYRITLWNDPWLVLSRQRESRMLEEVEKKIKQLRNEWQVTDDEYQEALIKCMGNEDGDTP
jgi:uncharacterized membrane protein